MIAAFPVSPRLINTGITREALRTIGAQLLTELPKAQEDNDNDVPIFLDDLVERYGEEIAVAMRRAGHKVRLEDADLDGDDEDGEDGE